MPFAGGIVCGDAHFFRQRAELSLNIPAETSCPVSNLFPVWICLAGFMLLFLTYFLSDKYRIHWLYGVSVFLCCFGLGAGMTEEYLHRTDFPFSDEAAVYQVILLEKPEMKERSVLCHAQLEGKVNDEDLQKSEYGRTFLFYFPRNSATVASNRGLRPTVVRTAKDQENIGITQVVHARYERTIRVIRFLITGVANG